MGEEVEARVRPSMQSKSASRVSDGRSGGGQETGHGGRIVDQGQGGVEKAGGIGAEHDAGGGNAGELAEALVVGEDAVAVGQGQHAGVEALDHELGHLDQELHGPAGLALGVEETGLFESQRALATDGADQGHVGGAEGAVEAPGEDDDADGAIVGQEGNKGPGLMLGGESGQGRILGVAFEP